MMSCLDILFVNVFVNGIGWVGVVWFGMKGRRCMVSWGDRKKKIRLWKLCFGLFVNLGMKYFEIGWDFYN